MITTRKSRVREQFGSAASLRLVAPFLMLIVAGNYSWAAQETAPVLKTETIAIPVRVVVRDRHGYAVQKLKKEDFVLFQDGQPEPISNFTPISGPVNSTLAESGSSRTSTAAPSTNPTVSPLAKPAASPERFLAVFFDDMHLQSNDLDYTRADADKYLVSSLQPTDHVSIVTASRQGELGFTTDQSRVHDAIMRLQIHPAAGARASAMAIRTGCPPMDYWEADAIVNGSGQVAASVMSAAINDLWICSNTDSNSMPPTVATAVVLNTAGAMLAEADAQTEAVLLRIEEVVHGLSALPGQRVIVLISPGFLYATHRQQLSEIIDRAIRSDVVVNTIETRRGIDGEAQLDLVRAALAPHGMVNARNEVEARTNLGAVESDAASASQKLLAEIADSTGGRFFDGSTNYRTAFGHLTGAPEFYYLLAYSPQNLPADGKYHTLKVRLAARSNLSVEARHGFYAPSARETAEQAAKRDIDDALFSDEEEHGLPITFETQVLQQASGLEKMVVKADVDVEKLDFQKVKQLNHENLTVVAALFDSDGNFVDSAQKSNEMNLTDATLAQLNHNGLYVELDFNVRPGRYVVRMVARDSNDGQISAKNASIQAVQSQP